MHALNLCVPFIISLISTSSLCPIFRYDVAHPVKKQSRFEWTKAELLRAYSLCRDAAASHTHPSQWANLLDEICSEAPPPPFTYDAKRHRAESQDFTGDA